MSCTSERSRGMNIVRFVISTAKRLLWHAATGKWTVADTAVATVFLFAPLFALAFLLRIVR